MRNRLILMLPLVALGLFIVHIGVAAAQSRIPLKGPPLPEAPSSPSAFAATYEQAPPVPAPPPTSGGAGEHPYGPAVQELAGGPRFPDSEALETEEPQPSSTGIRAWGEVGYLLWWIKNGPEPVPLVTTGNPNNPLAGVLGQPDTRVLFGGSNLNYGTFSGLHGTLGFWLNEGRSVGLEGSGFLLERRSVGFSVGSDAAGNPPLLVPLFDPTINQATGAIVSSSTLPAFTGGVTVASHTRLWGYEANAILALNPQGPMQLDLLAGYRSLALDEDLALAVANQEIDLGIQNYFSDRFATNNHFYGGQLGARAGWESGWLQLRLQGQVALGNTLQVVDRTGNSLQTGSDAFVPGGHPGGILVQPSNMGSLSHNTFTVVPAAKARIGIQLLTGLFASVSYDFLYWSSVVRPGQQIDPVVNPTQSVIFGTGVLAGPARPAALFQHSDFIAHGITFGLEYCY